MNKQDIKLLEANFLDGDSIDDCGACTHSTVMDIVDFFQERNNKKISKLLGDLVGEELYIPDIDEMIEYEDIIKIGKNEKRQECINIIKASEFKPKKDPRGVRGVDFDEYSIR